MNSTAVTVVLEPAARALAEATDAPPFLYQLPPVEGRKALEDLQAGPVPRPEVEIEDTTVPGGPSGEVSVRILRPPASTGILPVILYIHGAGWVFGSKHTHDRLIRELCAETGAVVVFPSYSRSPEAQYPVAIEENYAVLQWIADRGSEKKLDASQIAVAGDSVGGNMAAAMTLMAKERSGPGLVAQLLFYPVTDASFDTPSYHQFAEGYYLRRDGMKWFWDQYTTNENDRAQITASPLRATADQLTGLPPALVITGEGDVLRDEGEAYAGKLRQAGVEVTAVRYEAIVHDFVMLDSLRDTQAAVAAIDQAVTFLDKAFPVNP